MHSALKRLEADGLRKLAHGGNRKSKDVCLTEKGARLAERTVDCIAEAEAEALLGLSAGSLLYTSFLPSPLCYGGVTCEKLAAAVAESGVRRCFYGHLHGVSRARLHSSCKGVRTELVAADFVQFTPVRIFP